MVHGVPFEPMLPAITAFGRTRRRRVKPVRELGDVDLALLNGGPQLAKLAAATALWHASVSEVAPRLMDDARLLADDEGELQAQLVETAPPSCGPPPSPQPCELTDSEVAQRVAELTLVGLLRDGAAFRRTRVVRRRALTHATTGLLTLAVLVLTGTTEPLIIAAAFGALVTTTTILSGWFGYRGPHPTPQARRLIRRARKDFYAQPPAARRTQVARAVALFGGAVLWSIDPAFARIHNIPLQTQTAEYGYDVAPATWSNTGYTTG